jgi:nitroreductase
MEFMDVITSRKSVRAFLGKAVEEEKLMKILEAARLAPSWGNKQGRKYVVVKNKATINEIALGFTSWLSEVPVLLAACIDPKDSGSHNNMDYYLVDVGISTQQLVLAATNLGLGTCWVSGFDEAKVKKVLEIPANVRVVALIPLGYPAPISERSKEIQEFVRSSKRKPLEEMVHREKW